MAGTVVLSSQRAEGVIRWARFLATGDSGDGGYPAVSLASRGVHIDGTIIGVVTNPGDTAPTDNWDLTLVDADGLDRLGGVGANRDTSNSEWATVGRTAAPDEELLLTITGNSVNSATIEIVLFWTPSSSAGGSSSEVQVVGALPAGTNAIGKLAANSGVDIGDVDVTTVVPGTGATNLGKAADSVAGATDTGVAVLAIRDDSLTTLTPVDGDYAPLRVNSTGALHVTGGGGGTQYQEDAAHASGDTGTMALAVRKDTATQLAGTDGDYSPLITNASGALHVAVASGSVTASGSVSLTTATSGGATPVQFIDVDESEDEVKGSAGTLYSIVATNVASGTRYLKVYDGTAAGVSVGSTTPKWTVALPAGAGFVWSSEVGMAMSTGITIAATTGVAVADTGAPGANEVIVNVTYA